ncbi:hypothetical protein [Streptomyces mirabilis]|uniref:hypothetical protein n=1 Tax=Streptomyces mirabilis TaxID=68239 RepID=UPI003679D102
MSIAPSSTRSEPTFHEERADQDGPASDVVGQRSGDQQGRQQAERVGSEGNGQRPGGEVPLLLEDDQQRGGGACGHVQRCEDGSRPGERSGGGKQPAGPAGLRGREAGAAVMP